MRIVYMIRDVHLADHSAEQIVRIRSNGRDRTYRVTDASWKRIGKFSYGNLVTFDLDNGGIRFLKQFIVR